MQRLLDAPLDADPDALAADYAAAANAANVTSAIGAAAHEEDRPVADSDDAAGSHGATVADKARARMDDLHADVDDVDDQRTVVAPTVTNDLYGAPSDMISRMWDFGASQLAPGDPATAPPAPAEPAGPPPNPAHTAPPAPAPGRAIPQPSPPPQAAIVTSSLSDPVADQSDHPTPTWVTRESAEARRVIGVLWSGLATGPLWRKIAAGCIAVLFIIGLASIIGGGGDKTRSADDTARPPVAETTESAAPATVNGVMQPSALTAECPDGSTQPELAFSNDKRDAWVCVRALGVDGATLTVTFREPVVLTEVSLIPGWNYVEASGIDRWTEHRVVTRVLWKFSDDNQVVQNINPARSGATLKIDNVATQTVTMTVLETAEPQADKSTTGGLVPKKRERDDFAISRIQFIGHKA